MRLELLATKHRSLAVTACEWRAFGLDDPERLADAVFDRLLKNPDPSFADFYDAVDLVVHQAYERQTARTSILERFTSNLSIGNKDAENDVLLALSQLRNKHRVLLQLRYWDGLTEAEAAEALRLTPDAFAERQSKAEARFTNRLAKRRPELATAPLGPTVASAKPGVHYRRRD